MEGDLLARVKSLHLRGEEELQEVSFHFYINTNYFRSLCTIFK